MRYILIINNICVHDACSNIIACQLIIDWLDYGYKMLHNNFCLFCTADQTCVLAMNRVDYTCSWSLDVLFPC